MDPAGLQRALLRLAQDWADELGDVVAVDGKALRRSFETASERSPTHLLQAFETEAKLTLAQVKVDDKSNEIPAMPELLERHDWPGLSAIGKVVGERRLADGSESADSRYFLLSGKPSTERFARIVRSYWAIEKTRRATARQRCRLPRRIRQLALNIARMRPDKAVRPAQVRPRPAQRRRPARHDPGHPQARVGGNPYAIALLLRVRGVCDEIWSVKFGQ